MIFGTVASTGHNYSISLMHWRAIATLEQQRKYDQAIQPLATRQVQFIWLRHDLRYNITPVDL